MTASRIAPIFFVFLLAAGGVAEAQQTSNQCGVRRFGGPNRLMKTPVNTVAELQAAFVEYRSDIETVLRQSGWNGNPSDLFAAVANGTGVSEGIYETGTFLQWMAMRRNGAPTVKTNDCWGGAQPFEAFTINVVSGNTRYHLAVPKICGNISLIGSEELESPIPPPICKIQVRCEDGQLSVNTSGSEGDLQVSYTTPSGSQQSYSGPFEADVSGTYNFELSGARGGLTCSETASQACGPPKLSCSIDAPAEVAARDEVTLRVTGEPAGRVQSVELTAMREGADTALVSEALSAPYSWTGPVKKPGTYTVTAKVEGDGEPAECSETFEVVGSDSRWVARLFGAFADGDDAQLQDFSPVERRQLSLDAGKGFGAGIEYLARPWLGLELSAIFLDQDAHFVVDEADFWGMDSDTTDTTLITFGPNFHLTPDSKVDFYVGPFVGYALRDDLEFEDQGRLFEYDIDDDVGFGAQVGLDVPVCPRGRCFTFHSSLRYLDIDNKIEGPTNGVLPRRDFDLNFEPLIFSIGAGYRW